MLASHNDRATEQLPKFSLDWLDNESAIHEDIFIETHLANFDSQNFLFTL